MSRPAPGRSVEILAEVAELDRVSTEDRSPSPERWREAVARADGVFLTIAERLTADIVRGAPHLRYVASMSAGADHMDLDALRARAIPVVTVGPVLTEGTADMVWTLLLAAARRLGEGERALRAGTWPEWSPFYLLGQAVYGRSLGILGMGRIGQAVARRARGFAMTVQYHNRRPLADDLAQGARYRSLDELLAESDILVAVLPSTPETRGILDARALARLPRHAVLVNAGRGDALDLDALDACLASGHLAGVGLDVYPREPVDPNHPVLRHERVVAAPHLGSATGPTRAAMAETAARALAALLTGGELPPGAVRTV